MTDDRLTRQIEFVLEIDKLKSVLRRSYLLNCERRENSAEHSWHVAMLAIILAEHVDEPIDLPRVVKMLLVHDIVEVDAGDTIVYDEAAIAEKAVKEKKAAERIFGILPDDQRAELHGLWEEYEQGDSPEARFAMAVDRLMPLLDNYHTQGRTWQENGIKASQVLKINARIGAASSTLWEYARSFIQDAVSKGYLAE